MIYKSRSPLPDHVRVIFKLPASLRAGHIFLVGSFNDWSTTATPLEQDGEGNWQAEVDLPLAQICEFRYWIDGLWWADEQADGLMPSVYGGYNAIVDTYPAGKTLVPNLQNILITVGRRPGVSDDSCETTTKPAAM